MLANLSRLLEEYFLVRLEMWDYLAKHEYEDMLMLALNEDKDKLKMLSKEAEKIKGILGLCLTVT